MPFLGILWPACRRTTPRFMLTAAHRYDAVMGNLTM